MARLLSLGSAANIVLQLHGTGIQCKGRWPLMDAARAPACPQRHAAMCPLKQSCTRAPPCTRAYLQSPLQSQHIGVREGKKKGTRLHGGHASYISYCVYIHAPSLTHPSPPPKRSTNDTTTAVASQRPGSRAPPPAALRCVSPSPLPIPLTPQLPRLCPACLIPYRTAN
jgi:hypothetical protein